MWGGFVVQKATIDQRRALSTLNNKMSSLEAIVLPWIFFRHNLFSDSGEINVINKELLKFDDERHISLLPSFALHFGRHRCWIDPFRKVVCG